MNDAEFLVRLNPPREPRTGADILRHIRASGQWAINRIMGSAGDYVIELTYLPLGCHGLVSYRRGQGGMMHVQAVRSYDAPLRVLAVAGSA